MREEIKLKNLSVAILNWIHIKILRISPLNSLIIKAKLELAARAAQFMPAYSSVGSLKENSAILWLCSCCIPTEQLCKADGLC